MDFNYLSICLLILTIKDIHSTIYYSGSERGTYYEAATSCKNDSGNLLEYGMAFVNAMMKCELHTYVWIGTPFYKQLKGCYKGNSSRRTPPEMRHEDKRVAICADFCTQDDYAHFGAMTTECHCYTQKDFSNLEQSNVCQIPSCPGNSYDICGVNPYAMVFEKVVHFDIGSCQARNIMANGDSHEFTGYCLDVLPFLCKIGVSEDVKCFRNEQTSTEESVLLTTRSSDFTTTESATTEMTTTNDVITEIPTLQTDDTERITLIGDTTFISTQESSKMIETTSRTLENAESSTMIEKTSPTFKNTKMDDSTFLSTAESGTVVATSSTTAQVTIEMFTVPRTTYSTTISPAGKSSSSSSTFSFLNDQSTMNTITEQHTNDVDIISNPQYTTSGGTVIHLSQNHNESNNQALIICVSTTVAVIVIIILTVIFVCKVGKLKKLSKRRKQTPSVYFNNTRQEHEDDSSVYYNSVRFNNLYDFSRSSTINPFKIKEPMYDEEYLVYDQEMFTR